MVFIILDETSWAVSFQKGIYNNGVLDTSLWTHNGILNAEDDLVSAGIHGLADPMLVRTRPSDTSQDF